MDPAVASDKFLVANGRYVSGGRGGRRVYLDKPMTRQSLNGPQVTVIDGGRSVGCVYLPNSAMLAGFTITSGFVGLSGAGVLCESQDAIVSNCIISG